MEDQLHLQKYFLANRLSHKVAHLGENDVHVRGRQLATQQAAVAAKLVKLRAVQPLGHLLQS